MQLSEGKFYVMRDGAVVGPMVAEAHGMADFSGRVHSAFRDPLGQSGPGGAIRRFLADGQYVWLGRSLTQAFGCDLVRRYVPAVEASAVYAARNGAHIALRYVPAPLRSIGVGWTLEGRTASDELVISSHGRTARYATPTDRGGMDWRPGIDGNWTDFESPNDLIHRVLPDGVLVPLPTSWGEYTAAEDVSTGYVIPPPAHIAAAMSAPKALAYPTDGRFFRTVHRSPVVRDFVEQADAWFANGCTANPPSDIFLGVELETQDSPHENDEGEDDDGWASVDGWRVGQDNTVRGPEYRFDGKAGWNKAVQRVSRIFDLDHQIDQKCSFHIHTSLGGVRHAYGERFQRRLIGALLSRIKDVPTRVIERWSSAKWTEEYFEFKVEDDKYIAVAHREGWGTWEFRAFGNVASVADGIRCMELAVWCMAAAYSSLILPEWDGPDNAPVHDLITEELRRRQRALSRAVG